MRWGAFIGGGIVALLLAAAPAAHALSSVGEIRVEMGSGGYTAIHYAGIAGGERLTITATTGDYGIEHVTFRSANGYIYVLRGDATYACGDSGPVVTCEYYGFGPTSADGGSGDDVIDVRNYPETEPNPFLPGLTLRGGDGHDTLYGSAGNDALYGGRGADRLVAGAGDDIVDSTDHAASGTITLAPDVRVDCGDGLDRYFADAGDPLTGCEQRG